MLSVGNLVRVNETGLDLNVPVEATANQTGIIVEHPSDPLSKMMCNMMDHLRAELGLGPVYALKMTSGPAKDMLLTCFDEEVTVLSDEAKEAA